MTLTYQRFTAVLLLIYGTCFLSGIYYCLRVFWCAAARISELELEQRTNIKFLVKLGNSGNEIREMLVQICGGYAPNNLLLFPRTKEILKGRHFDYIDDIRSFTTAALKAIPQKHFQNYFERWTRRWYRWKASQGEYFEGDHGGIQHTGMSQFYRDEFENFIVRPRKLWPAWYIQVYLRHFLIIRNVGKPRLSLD